MFTSYISFTHILINLTTHYIAFHFGVYKFMQCIMCYGSVIAKFLYLRYQWHLFFLRDGIPQGPILTVAKVNHILLCIGVCLFILSPCPLSK